MKVVNLESLSWCNAGSKVVGFDKVLDFIKKNDKKFEIHVGCDSHFIRDKCILCFTIFCWFKIYVSLVASVNT